MRGIRNGLSLERNFRMLIPGRGKGEKGGKRGEKREKKRGKRKEGEQRCAFREKSDASFIDCAHHYALDYCRLSR